MKFVCVLMYFFLISELVFSQTPNWEEVPSEIGNHVYEIAYLESFGFSISGGLFTATDGVRYLTGFNGEGWEVLADTATSQSIRTIVEYDDGILIGTRGPSTLYGEAVPYAAYYDGEEWSFPWVFNQGVHKFRWLNDTLYAIGYFTEIDGQPANRIARLVDGQWEGLLGTLPDDMGNMYHFHDIIQFQGNLYVSGNIWQANGPNNFVKVENGELVEAVAADWNIWHPVGHLEIFQGDLYFAGGSLNFIGGEQVNYIFKWNGTEFTPIGEPLWHRLSNPAIPGGYLNMKANGDFLYLSGNFQYIGDVEIGKIARWDGNQWCGLFGEPFLSTHPSTFGFFGNQVLMYSALESDESLTSNFWLYTGGDAVSNCTEPLSVGQEAPQDLLTLHPNPAHTHATLTSAQQPLERLALYDLQGRVVHEARPAAPTYRIPLTGLPAGMYVVSVQVGGEVVQKKLVVDGAR